MSRIRTHRIKETHGVRWWLHLWKWALRVEFHWWNSFILNTVSLGTHAADEHGPFLHLGLFRFWLSVSLDFGWVKWMPDRTFLGLSYHDDSLWLSIWKKEMGGWTNPRGKSLLDRLRIVKDEGISWSFNWRDFLLGKPKYTTKDLEVHMAAVPMPEGSYPVQVTIFESTWKRPRWPWPRKMIRTTTDVMPNKYGSPDGRKPGDGMIPYPGKGESSWDCGQSGSSSSTAPCKTVKEAIEEFRKYIMGRRTRHGSGEAWRPEPPYTESK